MRDVQAEERTRAFARWLRQLREARQLEGRAVSRMIGASKNYISALEAGKIADPSFPLLMRLAALYGVDPAEMVERVYGLHVEDLFSSRVQLYEALRRLGYPDALAHQIASLLMQLAPSPNSQSGAAR